MSVYDQIVKLEERLNEADASSVIDTSSILKELLHDECKIVGPKGELFDKTFIMNAHGPKRVPFQAVIVDDIEIIPLDETAIVHSLTTYKMKDNAFTLRFFRVWKKQNDMWQVIGGSTTIVPKD